MKIIHWVGTCGSIALFLTAACAPQIANYKAVHNDAQNAQQSLDQSIQYHR
jgi:hypothetical protein